MQMLVIQLLPWVPRRLFSRWESHSYWLCLCSTQGHCLTHIVICQVFFKYIFFLDSFSFHLLFDLSACIICFCFLNANVEMIFPYSNASSRKKKGQILVGWVGCLHYKKLQGFLCNNPFLTEDDFRSSGFIRLWIIYMSRLQCW